MRETLYGSGLRLDHLSLFGPPHSLWKSLSHHFPSPSHCQLGAYHPLDACLPPLSTATSPLDGYLSSRRLPPPLDAYLPSRRLPTPPIDACLSTPAYPPSRRLPPLSTATSPSRSLPPLSTSSSSLDAYLHLRVALNGGTARHVTSRQPNPCLLHSRHQEEKEKEEGEERKGSGVMTDDEIVTTTVSRPLHNHQQTTTVMSSSRLQ